MHTHAHYTLYIIQQFNTKTGHLQMSEQKQLCLTPATMRLPKGITVVSRMINNINLGKHSSRGNNINALKQWDKREGLDNLQKSIIYNFKDIQPSRILQTRDYQHLSYHQPNNTHIKHNIILEPDQKCGHDNQEIIQEYKQNIRVTQAAASNKNYGYVRQALPSSLTFRQKQTQRPNRKAQIKAKTKKANFSKSDNVCLDVQVDNYQKRKQIQELKGQLKVLKLKQEQLKQKTGRKLYQQIVNQEVEKFKKLEHCKNNFSPLIWELQQKLSLLRRKKIGIV